jgi:hypothetical protein
MYIHLYITDDGFLVQAFRILLKKFLPYLTHLRNFCLTQAHKDFIRFFLEVLQFLSIFNSVIFLQFKI